MWSVFSVPLTFKSLYFPLSIYFQDALFFFFWFTVDISNLVSDGLNVEL